MNLAGQLELELDWVHCEIYRLSEAIEYGMARRGDDVRLEGLKAYREALKGLDPRDANIVIPDRPAL
jgi:hypothetical protein